ncbi:MAG: hypothetical protein GX442_10585 [Candidatus Riflebacteria bacterium]|nr:hypothetical protein [Candidatus Riflebacteria bacterium]
MTGIPRCGRSAVGVLAVLGLAACLAGAVWAVTANLRFSHRTHYDQNVACERCHVLADPASPPPTPAGWVPLQPSRVMRGVEPAAGGAGDPLADPVAGRLPATPGDGAPSITIDGEPGPATDSAAGTPPGPAALDGPPDAASAPPALAPTFGRPPEKTCLTCHPRSRHGKECGLCHLGRPMPTERDRKRLPEGIRFPHEAHKDTDCLDCHPRVTDWETLDGTMQDHRMEGCLKCHTGVKVKRDCTLCHDPTPHPKDHVRNFEEKHGLAYRADPHRCRTCHEDSSCVACHAQRPRSHTLAWVSRRHGLTAASRPDSCKACHTDPGVCLRCHDSNRLP